MNKRLIILFIGLVILVLVIVLNSTVFIIRDISVLSDCGTGYYNDEDIVSSSFISGGKNIFILSERIATDNIEKAHPDIRVTSIERKFPNKVIIHITLRIPVIALKINGSNNYFITDWELNVIDVTDDESDLYKNSAKINGLTVTVQGDAEELIGTALQDESLSDIKSIALAASAMGINDVGFKTFFNNIDFSRTYYAFIKTNSGVTLCLVTGTDTSIEDQFQAVYSIYCGLDLNDTKRTSGYYYNNGTGWIWSTGQPE